MFMLGLALDLQMCRLIKISSFCFNFVSYYTKKRAVVGGAKLGRASLVVLPSSEERNVVFPIFSYFFHLEHQSRFLRADTR